MGCLHADVRIVNGLSSCIGSKNGLDVQYSVCQKPAVKIKLVVSSVSDFEAKVDYKKALTLAQACNCNVPIFVKIDNYCGQIFPSKYLEIEPEFIWVYPDWGVENQVFSNTDWYIN